MHNNASSNGSAQQDPGSSDPNGKPSKPPSKPSLLNPKNANNNNSMRKARNWQASLPRQKEDITSPSRRESGRIKSLHVQRATLDAEAKARALKFTCSLFTAANIPEVKYLGMVDEEIAEKMDVEKMAKEHYKEGGTFKRVLLLSLWLTWKE